MSSIIGPNPKLYPWGNDSPMVMFESDGSLGKIVIDTSGVALACLAFLAAAITSAPISTLFVCAGAILLYNSCTKHREGVWGTTMAWGSFFTNGFYHDIRRWFS